MRTLKLVLEYDGTDFVGWQFQANGRSVQEEITKVLQRVLQEPITLIGAGRTDSGVHARGQVASFRCANAMAVPALFAAVNGLLPDDVRARELEEAPETFHARFDARERMYRYYVGLSPVAIGRHYQWHMRYRLDLPPMERIATAIVGEHDFASFCKSEAEVPHHRCTVIRSLWTRGSGMLIYEIRANRFLHGMVRALVGTMVDIGRGYTREEDFGAILDAGDRRRAGMAAPACGLFLEEVTY